MKVDEILCELRYRSDFSDPYKGRPRQPASGIISGYAGEWLKAMGATREDIPAAMEEAKKSPEYQRLMDLGFDDVTNEAQRKNGTFYFFTIPGAIMGNDDPWVVGALKNRDTVKRTRSIDVAGRIAYYQKNYIGDSTKGRLKSPPVSIIDTDPDLTPVQRLVKNYTRAMKVLADVQEPKIVNIWKQRAAQERQK